MCLVAYDAAVFCASSNSAIPSGCFSCGRWATRPAALSLFPAVLWSWRRRSCSVRLAAAGQSDGSAVSLPAAASLTLGSAVTQRGRCLRDWGALAGELPRCEPAAASRAPFLQLPWSTPTAGIEDPCRSEGTLKTRLTETVPITL